MAKMPAFLKGKTAGGAPVAGAKGAGAFPAKAAVKGAGLTPPAAAVKPAGKGAPLFTKKMK